MTLLGGVAAAVALLAIAWLGLALVLWLHRPSREMAGPVLRLIPELASLVRRLLADPATPRSARLALGGLLAYLVCPIDLIPDFIPGIGAVDDVILVALVLRWAARRVGLDRLRAQWTGSPEGFDVLRRLIGA